MYKRKIRGPSTVPCGTPDNTDTGFEEIEYPPHFAYLLTTASYIYQTIKSPQDSILLQKECNLLLTNKLRLTCSGAWWEIHSLAMPATGIDVV